jgi:hypothetical protein
MEIVFTVKKQQILLKGEVTDGLRLAQFSLSTRRQHKNRAGVIEEIWEPYAYHQSLHTALESILRLRIAASDAKTLEELTQEIRLIKKQLLTTYGLMLSKPTDGTT